MTPREADEELQQLHPARNIAARLLLDADRSGDEAAFQKARRYFIQVEAAIEACEDAMRGRRAAA